MSTTTGRSLAAGAFGNLFQLHDDRPLDYDAWDVDRSYLDQTTDLVGEALTGSVVLAISEGGGVRGAVRFRRSFGASTIDADDGARRRLPAGRLRHRGRLARGRTTS